MGEIRWIKIATNIFDDEKIRLIEKMPEGDTMLVIWLKLLTLAGKCNDCGLVYVTHDIPYTADMLSDIMGRDSRLVSLALNTFVSFGMIEITDNLILLSNWEKHQNVEGMEKIRQQTAARVRKHREQKKIEGGNVTVTLRNATEEEKNKKKKKKEESKKTAYGEFSNVYLSDDEHQRCIEKHGEIITLKAIEKLSSYKASSGKKYKSDYAAMNTWVFEDVKKNAPKKDGLSIAERVNRGDFAS